jgi:hypothetical protein
MISQLLQLAAEPRLKIINPFFDYGIHQDNSLLCRRPIRGKPLSSNPAMCPITPAAPQMHVSKNGEHSAFRSA